MQETKNIISIAGILQRRVVFFFIIQTSLRVKENKFIFLLSLIFLAWKRLSEVFSEFNFYFNVHPPICVHITDFGILHNSWNYTSKAERMRVV